MRDTGERTFVRPKHRAQRRGGLDVPCPRCAETEPSQLPVFGRIVHHNCWTARAAADRPTIDANLEAMSPAEAFTPPVSIARPVSGFGEEASARARAMLSGTASHPSSSCAPPECF